MNKFFLDFLDKINIKKNDILYIASNITLILLLHKKLKEKFDPNDLIDYFYERVGVNGTLLFPTFKWSFCRGIPFNYYTTPSETGALTKIALARKDFVRTKHPIYSFVVKGRDQEMLYNLDDESGWGSNSIFSYFHQNAAKNLFIGIDYKNGFTFDHYFEEKIGVDYRYFKYFEGEYTDRNKKIKIKRYKMYVRDLGKNVETYVSEKMDDVLIINKGYQKLFYENIYFGLIDMKIAGDIMEQDIKNKGGLIFAKSI